MLKKCERCGTRLPWGSIFRSVSLCEGCEKKESAKEEERLQLVQSLELSLVTNENIDNEVEQNLQSLDKNTGLTLYNNLFSRYEMDDELSVRQINVLKRLQVIFAFSNEEVCYDSKLKPYIYLHCIRNENELPKVEFTGTGRGRVILKPEEIVHFVCYSLLHEMRSVSLGYQGGSHGISIPVMKGIRYRVGSHKGQLVKEDRLVETSRGHFMITNKRIVLHPERGSKPYSVPLNKITFYQCYESGIEMFREGRQKGLYFKVGADNVDVIELCLNFLIE